ncbi:PIN domain-like protein, partial [Coemansia reversa NRRL 1564]
MGVKGLWTLLEPAARPVRLEALTHKRLAVDASIWLYQLVKAMKDADGNPIEDAHILGFYRRVCKLLYYGILPVFVFDGGAPELKRITINERQTMRGNTSYHFMRAELEGELQALRTRVRDTKRNASGVEADMVEDIRMLLTLFGVPYVTAPMEAEAQCAALVSSGLVDGMVTDDSDAFLFASSDRTQVYRHFFQKDRYVEMYSSNDIFQDSSLTQRDLVFLACLLGSDYTVGVKGIGPVLAMEALAEF